jgi:Icc-related predicted phosphoesterase
MTGIMIVPVVKQEDGKFRAKLLGDYIFASNDVELEKLEFNIRYQGFYPYHTDEAGLDELNKNSNKVDDLFKEVMVSSIQRWLNIAEERLKGTGIKCYMTPGNDDSFAIDDVLNSSKVVLNPEGKLVSIDDQHEMISSGYSNLTPWDSPREATEEELLKKIDEMARQVTNMKNAIFNFHCPPFDSGLDVAPKLDKGLKPMVKAGSGVEMIPVGSTAVRTTIEKYQPLLGLHGHIHEARGRCKIGRTLCLNPGSEYGEGVLRGVIVNIDEGSVKSMQFVSG